ncbi:YceK/YidQ family lipoprotein [Bisgaard Taxon 45]|uniref:YceK/YidQ family lipoprotein n=1 Tax=Bisgaard Taxon 45 TaxID=304289 RepID=A0ABT9KCE2_9PAST|nr:YceK/YidQ family lipoprotein [Bisgaard Taxon 45]
MQKSCLLLISLLGLHGCGTIVKLVDPTQPYSAYAGTTYDLDMAKQWGLPILDLPLSFILDTALLPYVWTQEIE